MNYGQHGRDLLLELKRGEGGNISGDSSSRMRLSAYNDAGVRATLQDLKLHVQALNDQVEAATKSSSYGSSQTTDSTLPDNSNSNKLALQVRPSVLLQNAAILRNKRCLLTYHVVRMQRIQELCYWQQQQQDATITAATAAGAQQQPQQQQSNQQPSSHLCPAEQEFLQAYQEICRAHVRRTGWPEDLRSHLFPPQPVDRVQVRVVLTRAADSDNNHGYDDDYHNNSSNKSNGSGDDDDASLLLSGPIVLESGATVNLSTGSTHFLLYSDIEEYIRRGWLELLDGEES
jgi:hypothetical protein